MLIKVYKSFIVRYSVKNLYRDKNSLPFKRELTICRSVIKIAYKINNNCSYNLIVIR